MHTTLSIAASQAFVEYFGTWAGQFFAAFGRFSQGALAYAQNRPIVAFAAVGAVVLLYFVTRSK